MKYSRRPKGPIKRKSLKNPRVTSPKLTRRSTTSMVVPILMSQGARKLTAREVMAVSPTTLEYLKWYEFPITFDHNDLPDFVPKPR
jgi:hypothetical protein